MEEDTNKSPSHTHVRVLVILTLLFIVAHINRYPLLSTFCAIALTLSNILYYM